MRSKELPQSPEIYSDILNEILIWTSDWDAASSSSKTM